MRRKEIDGMLGTHHRSRPVLRITAHLPLGTALAMMDVRVVDHVIVAGAKTLSFAECGLL